MSDYLAKENERYGEDDDGPDAPPSFIASSISSGDPIAEEYYKLLDAGCSLGRLIGECDELGQAKFINQELLPVWNKWKERTEFFTKMVLDFEDALANAKPRDKEEGEL